ncbi:Nmad2 family putative nucleotide modification protein [Paraburkholderia elongata]|uniref:Nucleotide modification associated domain-containing protein n=1 Tax=Paraburkholderia elongata TaxID=2675747 RepID=A0A972SMZ1_9BURK|nr:hypothetical protein [Paraburkholderia elongata]NPT61648.1 hypothetical protein [Paraburkholderia elongata]
MKLLKYVMTSDTGLAPNPYFDICSLALCTPNHMNARLRPGDWVVGHSCKATGNHLIYAMRLTKVLDMDRYFREYPQKRPVLNGEPEQRYGDNLYFREGAHWRRVPSPGHNSVDSFAQDRGKLVFLAEGSGNFWYFGAASSMPESLAFADRFPGLILRRQGFKYVYDVETIEKFVHWLESIGTRGRFGDPRDKEPDNHRHYLTAIEPQHVWQEACGEASPESLAIAEADHVGANHTRQTESRGCGTPSPRQYAEMRTASGTCGSR